jgi:hypothetical protein
MDTGSVRKLSYPFTPLSESILEYRSKLSVTFDVIDSTRSFVDTMKASSFFFRIGYKASS